MVGGRRLKVGGGVLPVAGHPGEHTRPGAPGAPGTIPQNATHYMTGFQALFANSQSNLPGVEPATHGVS
jgi:hypothetical protein